MTPDLAADRLNFLLLEAGMDPLTETLALKLSEYLELLLRWNRQLNLTSIRTADEILRRHFIESIFCACKLPPEVHSLLDYGSGGGFPGIPIACCRPGMVVTLAEAQSKKSIFLREVVRTLDLSATVHGNRAEILAKSSFGAVVLRAVDKMSEAVKVADTLIAPCGWIVLMIGAADVEIYRRGLRHYQWRDAISTPNSQSGVLLMGQRCV